MAKIVHCFFDFDMRCSHNGILEFLNRRKIKPTEDDFIVFMNTKRDTIKMLCKGKKAVLHYKSERAILDPSIVAYLPHYLDGATLNLEGTIRENLDSMLGSEKRRKGQIE